MLLIQTAVLASLASTAGGAPVLGVAGHGAAAHAAPVWAMVARVARSPWPALSLQVSLRLALPLSLPLSAVCGPVTRKRLAAPCNATVSRALLDALPSAAAYGAAVQLPNVRDEMAERLGGFVSFDVMKALHLSVGPRVSWLTPDSPREDLLRLRVIAPAWGVRYTWNEAISVGVATGSRFLMLGEDWPVVDVLTSEANIELLLP